MKNIISQLKNKGIGIIPTDTLYGLVGSAMYYEVVERIYKVRKRNLKKPMIVLIYSLKDLDRFNIKLSDKQIKVLNQKWPGKISVILDCKDRKFEYLHRGTNSIAFRVPDKKELRDLIKKVGPIVAPSANIEGKSPAITINEAKKYFGDSIDFYVDSGILDSKPSLLVKLNKNGEYITLR
jgi:L-threonylcarbamoyladenylate synthase